MAFDSLEHISSRRHGPAATERLRWIDGALRWEGRFRRPELAQRFSVSVSQASQDVATYANLAPGSLALNHRTKAYEATRSFAPIFQVSFAEWLRYGPPP
ncbi:hypothetical protein M0638_22935 [Roseomonas sp. NAR14]|uniref:DNA-binding transcriptional repressor CapW winged helix-turn-helix domain-containing protein n=1 Tax=Roseomonas acroporae TaxID=2937791 RepID=A0A9X1YBS7_9PROT|nr:hypothetical protein [Roseomonas acroporae]MCK8787233.1 hypothetical protein [Roseomonas acroporae]